VAQLSLFIVVLLALVIPIMMARLQVTSVPTAVAEIIAGIIMGQSGFNLIQQTSQLSFLSNLGVIILMFLSGMEINFDIFKKEERSRRTSAQGKEVSPLSTALLAFAGIAVMAVALALILQGVGLFKDWMLATILFMTVALGVVIATLKEKEILSRPIGQTILLTAVMGEVIPLLLLTIYASVHGGNASRLWLIILLFVAAIILLRRFKQPYNWFVKVTKATTQLDIRLAFFLIFALVTVAEQVGAENILGAFLAGMVMKLLEPSEATKDKLTSIGYGFFIPIFFMMTGVRLNLHSFFAHPEALVLLPLLVLFLLLAKMPAVMVYWNKFGLRNAFAGGFLTATTITIVLPTLQVARRLKVISNTQSDAFILAAVIVCIVSPIVFNASFKLTPEDRIKQRISIIGANALTMPVASDLHANWYSVNIYTDSQEAFDTYKSRGHLTLLNDLAEPELVKAGAFDCDILVAACHDDAVSVEVARLAKQSGVKRVIVRVRQPAAKLIENLTQEEIEIFDISNVRAALMRALIESPAVYQVMTATKSVLYEAVVKNRHYTGKQLMELDFIDQITVSRIRRQGKWLSPHGSTVIEPGDELIFSGSLQAADRVRQLLETKN
jgi:CPA2 family monovalent cation:H+ antiporter-2